MIVQRFLGWVQNAPAGARAEATSALARAYLYSGLDDRDRDDAEVALTSMLDDPSPLVRRALAEALASAREAPHHCVRALAMDQSDIASIVLARSPVLTDAELADCAAIGDVFAQSAIALRPGLRAPVAAALTEVGCREALISLAVNTGADVPERLLRRMIERFGWDGEMREAILTRQGLSSGLRAELVRATARALADFVVGCEWLPEERARRMSREAQEKGAITVAALDAAAASEPDMELAGTLRRAGLLTPSLALRALLSGARGLFVAALAELTGLPAARVAGLVNKPQSSGFLALYARAKLPPALAPVFQLALTITAEHFARRAQRPAGRLSRSCAALLRAASERTLAPEVSGEVISALRRLEAEAARESARQSAAVAHAPSVPRMEPVFAIDFAAMEAELSAA